MRVRVTVVGGDAADLALMMALLGGDDAPVMQRGGLGMLGNLFGGNNEHGHEHAHEHAHEHEHDHEHEHEHKELTQDEYVDKVAALIALERQLQAAVPNPADRQMRLTSIMGMLGIMMSRNDPNGQLKLNTFIERHMLDAHSNVARQFIQENENVRKAAQVYGMFRARGVLSAANPALTTSVAVIDAELQAQAERDAQDNNNNAAPERRNSFGM